MEHSKASLIDVTLRINPNTGSIRHLLDVDEVIALFTGCTMLRSLHVTGKIGIVYLDTTYRDTHSFPLLGYRELMDTPNVSESIDNKKCK